MVTVKDHFSVKATCQGLKLFVLAINRGRKKVISRDLMSAMSSERYCWTLGGSRKGPMK